jgi:N-acetylglucosaminyl-diphospho-decaprenol L-rhamnosyltransferase
LRRRGWDVVYEPAGTVLHVQGVSTARVPYRMLVEHHRSAYRFTERRYEGPRRMLLPLAAVYLSVRAVVAIAAHAFRVRFAHRSGPAASLTTGTAG